MLSVITAKVVLGGSPSSSSTEQGVQFWGSSPYTRARSGTCNDATRESPRLSALLYQSRHDRYRRAFCNGSRGLALLLLVVRRTVSFAAADDPFTLERSLLTGDHRTLLLSAPVVVVEDHPIAGLAHLMRSGGVRTQWRIVPLAALGM